MSDNSCRSHQRKKGKKSKSGLAVSRNSKTQKFGILVVRSHTTPVQSKRYNTRFRNKGLISHCNGGNHCPVESSHEVGHGGGVTFGSYFSGHSGSLVTASFLSSLHRSCCLNNERCISDGTVSLCCAKILV